MYMRAGGDGVSERLTHITVITDMRKLSQYQPGDVGKPWGHPDCNWHIACPQCGRRSELLHACTVNDDNTLTFSPSLVCPHEDCKAHYHIVNNEIRWC